jgi:hypothetical protein
VMQSSSSRQPLPERQAQPSVPSTHATPASGGGCVATEGVESSPHAAAPAQSRPATNETRDARTHPGERGRRRAGEWTWEG